MSKHYVSPKAICPFYKHEHPQMIYCDGVTEDSVTHEAFASKTSAMEYKNRYCRADYRLCSIYQMLKEIYT